MNSGTAYLYYMCIYSIVRFTFLRLLARSPKIRQTTVYGRLDIVRDSLKPPCYSGQMNENKRNTQIGQKNIYHIHAPLMIAVMNVRYT